MAEHETSGADGRHPEILGALPDRLDFRVLSADAEHVRARLAPQPDLRQGIGVLHGGVLFALADSAAATLLFHTPEGPGTTTDASIRFLAPVRDGAVEALARVTHTKGRSVLVEVELSDEAGSLVAVFQAHFLRVDPSRYAER